MVIATVQNGNKKEHLIEGKDFETWDDFPKDKLIIAISLSDGDKLVDSLFGFNHYIMCYEGALVNSTNPIQGTSTITNDAFKFQLVYGLRSLEPYRRQIVRLSATIAKDIDTSLDINTKNAHIIRARGTAIKEMQRRMKHMQERTKQVEVCELRLGITKSSLSKADFLQSPKGFRDGLADISDLPDDQEILDILNPLKPLPT